MSFNLRLPSQTCWDSRVKRNSNVEPCQRKQVLIFTKRNVSRVPIGKVPFASCVVSCVIIWIFFNYVVCKVPIEGKERGVLATHVTFSFKGFIVPVLTPFNDDSSRSLNLSVIPRYAEFLMKKGIKGVLVNGTSGEGMSMSVAERKIVAESWANAVKSTKQHLMIQVGGAPLPDVLELAKHAQSIGADSMLCLPELYFKPTVPQQLVKYLTLVSKAAPHTPLLYYHIPMFTNVNINMAQFLDFIGDKIPSFVGIKFTSTNLEEGAQALHIRNNKFVIFLGSDQIVAAAIAIGMDSFIATSINLLPELALEILQAGIKGEGLKARERQEKLSKAVMAISKYGTWVETMKAAMTLLTPINVGPPRAPLAPLPAESITAMTSGLKNLGYNIYT